MVGFRTKTPFGVGMLRASFYTGTTTEQAEALAAFMREFAADWAAEERARERAQAEAKQALSKVSRRGIPVIIGSGGCDRRL